ncbi:acyl-CoA dehydrogenase family protein [Alicyclobacillus mengziensis]|uniref:Acyl-CoA dehydrogenase family protein n=2 Tax=Alicyclobacillus mengziensis TaxID=2931921 RepID=A0A9X7VWR8_9BACL|nr:acyl-CoA dehydrogenase family protein [Alicyclobacillus mengziensis]
MISFMNTEEERAFVEMADAFAKEQLRVQARIAEAQKEVPNSLAERAAELGLCSLEVPESMEGLGLPLISQVQVLEALAFGDLAILQGLPGPNEFASFLRVAPDLPNVRSYLDGSSQSQLRTAAVIDALNLHVASDSGLTLEASNEGYVLCGLSRPIRMGKYAEILLVACRDTTGEAVLLLLDAKRTPWQVLPCDVRLGLLPAGIARVRFESRSVSLEDVLLRGEEAETALYQAMARQHVLEAGKEIGLMRASLEYATNYTAKRKAFGQEIAHFQGVSFLLADMAIEVQAARHLTWQAAVSLDGGNPHGEVEAVRALARVHRAVRFVTDNGVQLLGGAGYVQEYPVEKWMRDGEAQVMLYGRETELLLDGGLRILTAEGRPLQ